MRENGSQQTAGYSHVPPKELRRITIADLENSITEGQFRVCQQHLRDLKCPICEAPKEYYRCFCRPCYFALPEEMRPALWLERTDLKNLEIFVRAYLAAKMYLREIGRCEAIL